MIHDSDRAPGSTNKKTRASMHKKVTVNYFKWNTFQLLTLPLSVCVNSIEEGKFWRGAISLMKSVSLNWKKSWRRPYWRGRRQTANMKRWTHDVCFIFFIQSTWHVVHPNRAARGSSEPCVGSLGQPPFLVYLHVCCAHCTCSSGNKEAVAIKTCPFV